MDSYENEFEDLGFEDEDDLERIELTLATGEKKEFLISDVVKIEDETYMVVFDPEDDSPESDAFIFRQIGETESDYIYEEVEDTDEFNKVARHLMEMSDEYELEEPDED